MVKGPIYVTQAPFTGVCPECGKVVKVRLDKSLRKHGNGKNPCPGKTPVKGSVKRRMKKKAGSVRTVAGGAFESARRRH